MPVTTLFFENFVSVEESLIKSWFDVPITQASILVLIASAEVLFEGAFSLWVSVTCCHWGMNILTAHNKLMASLIKAYNTIQKTTSYVLV